MSTLRSKNRPLLTKSGVALALAIGAIGIGTEISQANNSSTRPRRVTKPDIKPAKVAKKTIAKRSSSKSDGKSNREVGSQRSPAGRHTFNSEYLTCRAEMEKVFADCLNCDPELMKMLYITNKDQAEIDKLNQVDDNLAKHKHPGRRELTNLLRKIYSQILSMENSRTELSTTYTYIANHRNEITALEIYTPKEKVSDKVIASLVARLKREHPKDFKSNIGDKFESRLSRDLESVGSTMNPDEFYSKDPEKLAAYQSALIKCQVAKPEDKFPEFYKVLNRSGIYFEFNSYYGGLVPVDYVAKNAVALGMIGSYRPSANALMQFRKYQQLEKDHPNDPIPNLQLDTDPSHYPNFMELVGEDPATLKNLKRDLSAKRYLTEHEVSRFVSVFKGSCNFIWSLFNQNRQKLVDLDKDGESDDLIIVERNFAKNINEISKRFFVDPPIDSEPPSDAVAKGAQQKYNLNHPVLTKDRTIPAGPLYRFLSWMWNNKPQQTSSVTNPDDSSGAFDQNAQNADLATELDPDSNG